MISILPRLRQTPQPAPERFLGWQSGCWMYYNDDTPPEDGGENGLAVRSFDRVLADHKQQERCSVRYSLQTFGETFSKEGLLAFRNMGVEVDLVRAPALHEVPLGEIDRRKEEYLLCSLDPFPLKPHWLAETRYGFQIVFRVQPVADDGEVRAALALNRRLARVLNGDEDAARLTQAFRVPGMLQFMRIGTPFVCRLLIDHADVIAPYDHRKVAQVVRAWETFYGVGRRTNDEESPLGGNVTLESIARCESDRQRLVGRVPPWLAREASAPAGESTLTEHSRSDAVNNIPPACPHPVPPAGHAEQ